MTTTLPHPVNSDELLIALERAGEPTTSQCAESYMAMLADMAIDGSKDRADAVYEAVLRAKKEGAGLLPEGAYVSLSVFETQYEPMGAIGRAAMTFAGMGNRYASHHVSLRQMLACINDDARDTARLDPASNYLVAAYTDLRLARRFIEDATRDNARLLDNVRGPWAAKLIEQCAPAGELSRYPHLTDERMALFASLSKGYRAPRRPAASAKPVPNGGPSLE